ncbi:hypothetical protein [Phaeobacter sp. C3_T13_0]|uniref:hypothetical protein n=1 Tax=Phaeobacter cretensis TaxID=3342641 RepID=UPI0039BD354C
MNSPEYNGDCALAGAIKKGQGELPKGREDISVVLDGKTYLFTNGVARMIWRFTYAPSGKLGRWILLTVVIGALIWSARQVLS